ncbi:MAG: hypothetical protein JWM99_3935, partial [Verrucomicrobiales bacterium]|nr:hypothetical protein [Verrucomicrobiales bacterium]
IISSGDDIARFARQTAYGTSFPDPDKAFGNASWYFSSERAFEMATAFQLIAKPAYLEAILGNMNYEGGCNPVNMTYVTGLGWQRQREIVHQYAQNDFRVLPPSGFPLGNIQSGFAYLDNYKLELGALCFPPDGSPTAPYPFYDRWGDSFNTTTEFVIVDQARGLATMAYLMARTTASTRPSVKIIGQIIGVPALIPAGQSITATFAAPGLDLTTARIVWEASDQEPFIGSTFQFSPKNPAAQWAEVEAQWPDGTRVFAHTNFQASFSLNVLPNSYLAVPLQSSMDMVGLYHLDGGLRDATGKNLPLTLSGNAQFDVLNLGWMAWRSGKALRFYDLGDNAIVTIPASLLFPDDSIVEIDLEAMVYVNSYKGYNRDVPRLLNLENDSDANLGWIEDIYTGPHVRGGTQFDCFGDLLNLSLPLRQWCQLSMRITATEYSLFIDGKLISSAPSDEISAWGKSPATLEFGNFDGWVDEVVIRSKIQTPPANPATFAAQAASGSSVSLNWGDLSRNEKGFRLYRSLGNQVFDEFAEAGVDVTSWTDSGLQPLTQYYYALTSFNSAGESSAIFASVRTPAIAPSGLAAGQESNGIYLLWNPVPGAASYKVRRALRNAGPYVVIDSYVTSVNFLDESVIRGSTYYYTVSAVNSSGESSDSNIAIRQFDSAPSAPTFLRLKQAIPSRLTLFWSDTSTNEVGFVVERSTDGIHFAAIAKVAANYQWFEDGTFNSQTTYFYRVRAFNSAGTSGYSNTISVGSSPRNEIPVPVRSLHPGKILIL